MSEPGMNKDSASKRSDAIAEEAAEYFIALKTPNAKIRSAFIDWLKVSPEHVTEFLAVAALWDDLPKVSAQPTPEELIQLAAVDQNVVGLGGREPRYSSENASQNPECTTLSKRHRRHRWLGFAAAATLAAIVVAGALPQWLLRVDPNRYQTAVGEQTSISLADGSVVTLNTRSVLRVDYSEEFRVVHLAEGEALFEVAKDPARPFRVITGSTVIQVVGTQFNVRRIAEDVMVTVVEGIVDVTAQRARSYARQVAQVSGQSDATDASEVIEPVRLTVGQQARIEPRSGRVAVTEVPKVENAIAWQQRRLVFEDLSLKEVIDEFNRYNDPAIVIDDPELQLLPISGVFRANDRESFVQFLAQMKLAESETQADGTIVLRRVTGAR